MFGSPILDSTSFSTLDETGKKSVRDLFDDVYKKRNGKLNLDNNMLFNSRAFIPIGFEFYKNKLDQTNPALFEFLNEGQKESLTRDLLYSFYIFSAHYQLASELFLDASESRRKNLQECGDRIKRCAELLDRLQPVGPWEAIRHSADFTMSDYVMSVEGWSRERLNVQVKDLRNEINSPRLYWVWASSWIQSWIDLLPDNFFHKEQAQYAVLMVSPVAGFLSFSLYLANALVELIMLAKHTIRSDWWSTVGEQQLTLSAWRRFCAHFNLRKYSILNDGIWGLGNLACFFWLTGSGLLGVYGNVATTALLLMDVILSGLRYHEEWIQHRDNSRRYERDIKDIVSQLAGLNNDGDDLQKTVLLLQLQTLQHAEQQGQFEWKYKAYGLIKDVIYAVILIAAFAMVCCFFLSAPMLTPTATLFLSVGGTALCYLSSIINDAVEGILDIYKSQELRQQADVKRVNVSDVLFADLVREPSDIEKKRVYMEIKQWEGEALSHKRVAHHQTMKLVYDLALKLLLPPVMLSTFVFFSFEIAAGLFIIGFILALALSQVLVGAQPEPSQLPDFDPIEYESWAKATPKVSCARHPAGFFSGREPVLFPPQDAPILK